MPLPADATVKPSRYATVVRRSFLLQEDESRRESDQVEVQLKPYYLVGPEIDNRILCVRPEGIPTLVRRPPITYQVVAPVSQCSGSRQFAVSLHFAYQSGNSVKIESGNLSAVNLVGAPAAH